MSASVHVVSNWLHLATISRQLGEYYHNTILIAIDLVTFCDLCSSKWPPQFTPFDRVSVSLTQAVILSICGISPLLPSIPIMSVCDTANYYLK